MGKRAVPFVEIKRNTATRKATASKKHMSHGSFRCARHPNSKRCRNGSTK
jgi:hypothetical protein